MILDEANLVSQIALERPASVRRLLPNAAEKGWVLPEYYVGSENQTLRYVFAEETLSQLVDLSPLVFYGEKGVGKTALAITLAVRWSRMTSRRPVTFANGNSFAADYAAALEIDDLNSFRERFRNCQLLLLDDLEGLAHKAAACTELAHTLDALSEARRPVLVSTRRLPATVRGLSAPLISRLTAGLSIPIVRPGNQARQALVHALVEKVAPALPKEVVVDLCAQFSAPPLLPKDIEQVVLIAAQNQASDGTIDPRVIRLLANQLFTGDGPTLPLIAKAVARKLQVRLLEMRGATREANIVRARGLAIHLARRLTPASLQQIGEFFGGRDHSTILHACRKTEKLLDSDTELATLHREIQAELLR